MEIGMITHAVSAIESKVSELRVRSSCISFAAGLRNGVWMWVATLVLLGGAVLLIPVPGVVRASLVGIQVAAVLCVFGWSAVRPIVSKWSQKHWALYCEEVHPRLNKRLVTCLDIAGETDGHLTFSQSPVAGLLLQQTAAEIDRFEPRRALPVRRALNHVALMLVPLALLGLSLLLMPTYTAALFTALYRVEIPVTPLLALHTATKAGVAGLTLEPGDVEIARGATVEFAVHIDQLGKGELDVVPNLHIQRGEEKPAEQEMLADETASTRFNLALLDVQEPFEYHATVAGLTTPAYSVTLFDPPAITSISATITPPEFANLPVEELSGTFYSARVGSTVRLELGADTPISEARLVPEDGDVSLGVTNGQSAHFEFILEEDQSFRAVIVDVHGHENLDPPLIGFEAIPDMTPVIKMKRPGADWALHPIGELELLVEVDDDAGLRDVQLEYQVNDGAAQIVGLMEAGEKPTRGFTGSHILQLEELDLAFGDVILYRVRARDSRPDEEKSSAYSQPYFLTIRPYDQDYFQGGPSGGGESMQMPNQKEVIIATTRLIDREPDMDADIMADRSAETGDTQRVIEDRTQIILGKMRKADVSNRPARVAHLEKAIEAMQSAAESLDAVALRAALPQENSALSHLLAAFAGLPKGIPGSSEGSGGAARMDLLDQKFDRKTQKYETMEGLPVSATRDLDEAIAKTKILAQRQKEFAETIRREREQAGKASSGGGSGSPGPSKPNPDKNAPTSPNDSPTRDLVNKEEMLKALEESQRELQKLKDAMLDRVKVDQEISDDLQKALQNVAQEMKRLNNAMQNDQLDEAQGANTRALEKLRQVQLQLQQAKMQLQSNAIQTLIAQVEAWKQAQSEIKGATGALGKSGSSQSSPSREEVASQQADLATETTHTSDQVSVMTPMANDPNPPDYMGLGKRLDAAGRLMKDASELIESEEDMKAASRQVEALELLEGVQQELQAQMKNQLGDELERLREAMVNVEGLREELRAELTRVESSDETGKPGPGKPTSATPGPGGGPSGASGVGGLRKDGPVEEWVDGSVRADGPAMAHMRSWDPRSMTVRLGTIQYLLEPNSPAAPLIEGLLEMVASDMWAAPEAPEGSIEYIGEFSTMLDKLEEIMAIELAGGDQLQRLNQSGVEDLPPRFREMASDYFESLATQARESNSSGN